MKKSHLFVFALLLVLSALFPALAKAEDNPCARDVDQWPKWNLPPENKTSNVELLTRVQLEEIPGRGEQLVMWGAGVEDDLQCAAFIQNETGIGNGWTEIGRSGLFTDSAAHWLWFPFVEAGKTKYEDHWFKEEVFKPWMNEATPRGLFTEQQILNEAGDSQVWIIDVMSGPTPEQAGFYRIFSFTKGRDEGGTRQFLYLGYGLFLPLDEWSHSVPPAVSIWL